MNNQYYSQRMSQDSALANQEAHVQNLVQQPLQQGDTDFNANLIDIQVVEPAPDYIAMGVNWLKQGVKRVVRGVQQRTKSAYQSFMQINFKLRYAAAGMVTLVVMLAGLSFSIGEVIVQNDYRTIVLAKPAAPARVIRQTQVASFGTKVSSAFGVNAHVAHEFADWILEASERSEIAPELLASLVVTESSFRKQARSNVGAIGPAQIRPDYWGEFCGDAKELSDPEQNVYCGAQVLSHLLERCDGDQTCALAAYNVGPYANRPRAADRYLEKIDRYLSTLEGQSL